jgi:hypothetical protein
MELLVRTPTTAQRKGLNNRTGNKEQLNEEGKYNDPLTTDN